MEANTAPKLYKPDALNLKKNTGVGDFSFFPKPISNTIPSGTFSVLDAYQYVIDPVNSVPTHVLRTLKDKNIARNYKSRNFDYICASGTFSKRGEAGLIMHSGILTLDVDHVENVHRLAHLLINDTNFETVLAFISPSGDGFKWFIKIDITQNTHLQWFTAVSNYMWAKYRITADKSGKDVSRCCFLPYDPYCFINDKYI